MTNYTFGRNCQIDTDLLNDIYQHHFGYKQDGVFVEAGAFDCYSWSNTYGLAKLGWKGLYFEPQSRAVQLCKDRLGKYPNIEIVHAALSNWQGYTNLYLGGSLSTISEEAKRAYLNEDWSRSTGLASEQVERVPVSTLAFELAARSWPQAYDLLVIDVEGSEVEVLQGYDIESSYPKVAIVETHAQYESDILAYKAEFINAYFEDFGYEMIYEDYINSIYAKD